GARPRAAPPDAARSAPRAARNRDRGASWGEAPRPAPAPGYPEESAQRQLGMLRDAGGRTAQLDPGGLVGGRRGCAAARGALDESFLDQERLVNVLERARLLAHDDRERAESDRAALVLPDQGVEQPAVHLVEPALVHLEQPQRLARHRKRDHAVRLDQR